MRLQQYLAHCGICSRRRAEDLISQGRVSVNGTVVSKLGSKIDPNSDIIIVDEQECNVDQKVIYAFHKPEGVVSTLSDTHNRASLADYLSDLPVRVFPVGRLDRDVVGLMIVTNDGDYANRMLHPKFGVGRTYIARVRGHLDEERKAALLGGIVLKDILGRADKVRTLNADSFTHNLLGDARSRESIIEICVSEGRKHFVKLILGAAGLPVIALARISFGPYKLGDLEPGELREESFLSLSAS